MRERLCAAILGALFSLGVTPVRAGPSETATSAPAAVEAHGTARQTDEEARLDRVRHELDAVEEGSRSGGSALLEAPSLLGQLVKTLLVLGAVCFLAYLILGKLLPRAIQLSPTLRRSMAASPSRGLVVIADRLVLDQKRALYVVKVGREQFLIGTAGEAMTMLSRLEAEPAPAPPSPPEAPTGPGRFSRLLDIRSDKESGDAG